jgi:WD40 repeat protein
MNSTGTCPKCQRRVPTESPRGLCPFCILTLATPAPTPAGDRRKLGRFELLEELGRGGFGVVYRARHEETGEECAVKLLRQPENAEARLRFAAEIEANGRLKHPHIVRQLEAGEGDDGHWYAMELVEGSSLGESLRKSLPPVATTVHWMIALASAVQHAHSLGILHRDLKPANVLLGGTNRVYLTDFGLAKLLGPAIRASLDLELSLSGGLVGSASYMAPEQARGDRAAQGVTTDIYGLGAILYHCLTGRPPFVHGSLGGLLQLVESAEPVSPRQLNGDVPVALENVCLKCLEKEPAKRYVSADALAADLARFQQGLPTLARPRSLATRCLRWARRQPVAAGLAISLLATLLSGLGGVAWQWHKTQRANLQLSRLRDRQAVVLSASQLAQGRPRAALVSLARSLRDNPDNPAAATLLAATLANFPWPVPVFALGTNSIGAEAIQVSPDGRYLATLHPAGQDQRQLSIWAVAAGERLADWTLSVSEPGRMAFDAGSRTLSLATDEGVRQWSLSGVLLPTDEASLSATLPPPIPPWLTNMVRVSAAPALPRLAAGLDSWNLPTVTLWDTETRQLVTNAFVGEELPVHGGFGVLGPNPVFLTLHGSALHWRDGQNGALACPPLDLPGLILDAAWCASEGWVATACYGQEVSAWRVSLPESPALVWSNASAIRRLTFSPDGRHLAVGTYDDVTHWPARPGEPEDERSANLSDGFATAWFEDGQRLAIANQRGIVRIVEARSGRPTVPPMTAPGMVEALAISPDQRWLAVATTNQWVSLWDATTGASAGSPLHLRPEGDNPWNLNRVFDLRFSPDSRWLALASSANAGVIAEVPSLRPKFNRRLDAPFTSVAFSPDSHWAALSSMGQVVELIALKPQPRLTSELRHPDKVLYTSFSPDGRWLVSSGERGSVRVWSLPSGALLHDLSTDGTSVPWVEFSPDSRTVSAITHAGNLWQWESSLGLQLGLPQSLTARKLLRARFSPDGRQLAVGSIGGQVWIIPQLLPSERPPTWIPELAEGLAGERAGADGVASPVPSSGFRAFLQQDQSGGTAGAWFRLAERFLDPVSPKE